MSDVGKPLEPTIADPAAAATCAHPVQLVRDVTRRLFVALSVLLAVTLALAVVAAIIDTSPVRTGTGAFVPLLVILSGGIGGFISIQRRLKQFSVDDLKLFSESWIYISLAPLVGGMLALVLYILFLSGILAGDLFPSFKADPTADSQPTGITSIFNQHAAEGFKGYAKLLLWSFVSGFSEKFVTDIIGQFEKSGVQRP